MNKSRLSPILFSIYFFLYIIVPFSLGNELTEIINDAWKKGCKEQVFVIFNSISDSNNIYADMILLDFHIEKLNINDIKTLLFKLKNRENIYNCSTTDEIDQLLDLSLDSIEATLNEIPVDVLASENEKSKFFITDKPLLHFKILEHLEINKCNCILNEEQLNTLKNCL